MQTNYEQAAALVKQYGQEHLLQFYPELSEEAKEQLLDQIVKLPFELLQELSQPDPAEVKGASASASASTSASTSASASLEPVPAHDWDTFDAQEQAFFAEKGWDMLRRGKVGALVVAGGQGSRLGHEGPKGTFDIGLPSGKSLFQLQAERLLNLGGQAGRPIPWYIMTSPENHEETVQFFRVADFFGYAEDDCFFFQQRVMPAIDTEGRILLADKGEIGFAPSGNGECFAALQQSGALRDMKQRGVEWLFYYNVDNALIKVADPLFVGVAAHYDYPIATKTVEKAYPEEKVGILCLKGGRPAVVEYTDVPEEVMQLREPDGRLTYGLGNISIHLFRRDFIEQQAETGVPYHKAHKKIKYIDNSGDLVQPEAPNAYKFERFIFDFFPLAEQMTVLNMKREEEFAPVKNKEGVDSPATARELVLELHRQWLLAAGVSPEALAGRQVEISPLVSYAGEGLSRPETLRSLGL
ncbi:UTP--glucose-1-phosphate uridylyltransferase [Paenibacillus cremeus]|uniref:UDPGP type 1 family protein n=1 Tax=Paenibacillus cremeus TaxID=2163881 RepID=A0A559K053_9BACL|nr:UDPGP type 1 family protein [Paenibacillus cremeus]TVY05511.1 UDPGP type 1 family protein [Paenibacillus cremeus]